MNYNYDLRTGENKLFDRVISSVSSSIKSSQDSEKKASSSFSNARPKNKILATLSTEILRKFSPHLEKITLVKGQEVYNAGDDFAAVYLPETAVISEFQILPDGRTSGLMMIGNEGMCGVSALLGSSTSNNWAQTLVSGTALKINLNFIRQIFDCCRFTKKIILEYLNSYLAQIFQKAVCNNHHQVAERLCSWILMLDDRCSNQPLSLTQEQFAFFLGAQRPSVTIVTQNLRAKGLIDYRRGKVSILNRRMLESTACSCYETAKL